jgi:hypothetical protein
MRVYRPKKKHRGSEDVEICDIESPGMSKGARRRLEMVLAGTVRGSDMDRMPVEESQVIAVMHQEYQEYEEEKESMRERPKATYEYLQQLIMDSPQKTQGQLDQVPGGKENFIVDGYGEQIKSTSPDKRDTPSTVHKGPGLALRMMSASPKQKRISPSNRQSIDPS